MNHLDTWRKRMRLLTYVSMLLSIIVAFWILPIHTVNNENTVSYWGWYQIQLVVLTGFLLMEALGTTSIGWLTYGLGRRMAGWMLFFICMWITTYLTRLFFLPPFVLTMVFLVNFLPFILFITLWEIWKIVKRKG
ncbi:hypothetical protein KC573_01435 [candidate division WWE3 bacterium]|uniref:Uncharacterized protein n=1 Tax=candidate division WWE3 bacterium TaxID=2053526 RepID=A0A955RX46_UNCKA|nr:hypothetical protein [candidate division WWE3 bacterium]